MGFAVIRKDLVKQSLSVPVGDSYVSGVLGQRFEYRWVNEDEPGEQFQVFHDGSWQDAESIDFDFQNN